MRVATLILTLGLIGGLLLLSANFNVGGSTTNVHRLAVDPKSSARAAKGPYAAWASGQELHNPATASALSSSDVAPSFGSLHSDLVSSDGATAPVEAAAPPAQKRACAPGCEKRGVCNTDLGRCDCPPYIGGDACDTPLIAACAAPAAVGLTELAAAPCVYDQLSANAPVSCECLMGCEAIGLMGVRECYVMDESNRTVMQWVQSQIHLRGLAANKEFFAAHLKLSHQESVKQCSGHGVYAPRMPNAGAPPANSRKRCFCYAGWGGMSCEQPTLARPLHACMNGCSGRGSCLRNWCKCEPGFYGTDCSLGEGSNGDGAAAKPLPPPIGAQRDANAPKVYIYDLPPRFNGWMHAGDAGWWQDMDLWGEDVIIHRRALRSYYRVNDPSKADYFLVPVWDSSAMWQMNWGFRDLLPTGVRVHKEAAEYVQKHWPYFDRKGGADHLWVFGHDQGGWRIRQKLPLIAKGIFISPFGGGPHQRGGHVPGQDIVCPSVVQSTVLGLMNHAHRAKKEPSNLAFFQGKLNLHIPYEYSFGIRQGLYKAHRNTPRIVVKEGHEANRETYFTNMCSSKFCVAAAGFGFSTRAYEAASAGCVPLIMQDGIEQAYEELLPWPLFALRLNNSLGQISNLASTLEAIPEERVKKMRSLLYCVWPRFLWLRHDEGASIPLPNAQRLLNYDAFESIMWTLRKRLHKDINWPADWAEGCKEVTRYFATSPLGGGRPWQPWANYEFEVPS